MNKKVYLSDLEWIKTHDNMGGVKANIVFKDNMTYGEYKELHDKTYYVLTDNNLEEKWNSLREFVIQLQKLKGINQQGFSWGVAQEVLDKMNELKMI